MHNQGQVLSVTDLTRRVKGILETSLRNISVQGEISNCKLHSSGHLYFTLKDENSQVQALMWRSRVGHLFFTPQDGLKVVVRGNLTVYELRGVYQIDVVHMQPLGAGELQMAFERLKQKLADEGLFAADHKKPLPPYPDRIGIITSPTGAAIRDMIHVLARRFPAVEVVLCPVKVQGAGAAEEIADAIRNCNSFGQIDVLIVGRGGGSLEDLWAFNEEVVARAIFGSRIPVISAVGHEVDFTIADFVADLRAPTPSVAAELVVPNTSDLVEIIRNFHYTCNQRVRENITSLRENIVSLCRSYAFNRPFDRLRQQSQRFDELQRLLGRAAQQQVTLSHQRIASLHGRLAALNPDAVIGRGYAVVFKNSVLVTRAQELAQGDSVEIKFHDGRRPAVIEAFKPS